MAEELEENGKQNGQGKQALTGDGQESNDITYHGDQLIESSESELPMCDKP